MMISPPLTWSCRLRACLVVACVPLLAPASADTITTASANEGQALQDAITDLITTFGERYPGGKAFLERLAAMEKLSPLPRAEFDNLRREALLVHNAVDLSRFDRPRPDAGRLSALRASLGLPAEAPVVGSVGRLTEQKGYAFLLRAAPLVLAAVPVVQYGTWMGSSMWIMASPLSLRVAR